MNPDLLALRLVVAMPALDRAALHRELSALRRRRTWPSIPTVDPDALLAALAVAPGSVPGLAAAWLASLPREQAIGLLDDLLACLSVFLRRMPSRATSLLVEDN